MANVAPTSRPDVSFPVVDGSAAPETISGGHLVAKTLKNEGIDVIFTLLDGYGEEVRDPRDIRPALERARASGKPSLINVWIDPDAFAPGTMNQTMYK